MIYKGGNRTVDTGAFYYYLFGGLVNMLIIWGIIVNEG